MTRRLHVLAIVACLVISTEVRAQVTLDVNKVSCGQFVTYKIADPKNISIWISGYYHGVRKDSILDTQAFEKNRAKLEEYCIKNTEVPLLEAVEKVLGGEQK